MTDKVICIIMILVKYLSNFKVFIINDGFIMLGQFRVSLERLNCQFEDFQCLALFAYFDDDNDG